jgi:tetratricopeptide (TPR) repeat protein
VRLAYDKFVKAHPEHVKGRIAYGSFLRDLGRDPEALKQWEEARRLAPANPAIWNNLGNYYGENGPVTNAFACYAKAIELDPQQPIYYHSLAQNVYLNQEEAGAYYGLKQREVVRKAQAYFRKTLELAPTNFYAAADLAQSFYALSQPLFGNLEADRKAAQALTDEAVAAWQAARKLAPDETDRQGICLHLARVQISAGRFDAARQNLAEVKAPSLAGIKAELEARLEKEIGPPKP